MVITQRTVREDGGWSVQTIIDGEVRRTVWTAGSKRDAQKVAEGELNAVLCAGCDAEIPMTTRPSGWLHIADGTETLCKAHGAARYAQSA